VSSIRATIALVTPSAWTALGRSPTRDRLPALPLRPLIAQYTAIFGSAWAPVTRRKHADDFARFTHYLVANGLPVTTASLDFLTLADYVSDLRTRPKVSGVWRGTPNALGRSLVAGPTQTLSANSVFKADVFDKLFGKALGDMKSKNAEGELLTGRDSKGIPFDLDNVQQFLGGDHGTLPAGAACLALAWRWRDQLELTSE
jgi:hypothetical protein